MRRRLRQQRDPAKAKILQRFFKTGPGEYGAGDRFLGLTVPQTRKIAKQFSDLPFADLQKLIKSSWHEERLAALLIALQQFRRGNSGMRQKLYRWYLANTRWINNWDLVDLSAEHIVGAFLKKRNRAPLYRLARSRQLWERRIAMLATFHYIKQGDTKDALRIAELLLRDEHDLMHKAVGWMLREVGKRCGGEVEETFLRRHAAHMPRTMLRYAIERFPEKKRQGYLRMRSVVLVL